MTLGRFLGNAVSFTARRASAVRQVPSFPLRAFSSLPDHTPITMPALSPTMEEGTIARWVVKEGDFVEAGGVICEVETDKATVDYELVDDGFVAKILATNENGTMPVGSLIGVLVEEEADVAAFKDVTVEQLGGGAAEPTPAPAAVEQPDAMGPSCCAGRDGPVDPSFDGDDVVAAPTPVATPVQGRIFASPLAKMMARERGISLSDVPGTGPNGRIVKADIDAYVPTESSQTTSSAPSQAAPAPGTPEASFGDFVDRPISDWVAQEAATLSTSKKEVPHYYLNILVDITELLKVRESLNAQIDSPVSVNDFVVRAAALTMKSFPDVNSSWQGSFIREYHNCDINVAMASPDGVVKPVIRNANQVGLADIAKQCNDMYEKVQNSELTGDDLARGTFTVTNSGTYGVNFATSIVYPNQAATLNIGAIKNEIVPGDQLGEDGQPNVVVRPTMPITISCDHRVVDGAVSAQWLQEFRSLLENPMKMLL